MEPIETIDTLSPEAAGTDVLRYQSVEEYQPYFELNAPKAFTMELQELQNAVNTLVAINAGLEESGQTRIDSVRFYLGQKKQWSQLGSATVYSQILINSLVMVPVQGYTGPEIEMVDINGSEQKLLISFPSDPGTDIPVATIPVDGNDTTYNLCYDFTYPCPATCPVYDNSILKYAESGTSAAPGVKSK